MSLRFITLLLLWTLLTACSSLSLSPTSTRSPLEIRGQRVFKSYCSRCHGTSGETVVVGPSLAGIATRGGTRIEGMDAQAYIRNSILEPNAYTVEGFPEGIMPPDFKDQMSPQDLEAIVAYLLTLK